MKSCWMKSVIWGAIFFFASISTASAGDISGIVTDESGNPLQEVNVHAREYNGERTDTISDASGSYTFSGLPAGRYTVYVDPPSDTDYVGKYYNNSPDSGSAKRIYIEEDISASGIDFSLAHGGKITGTVTDVSGIPLQGVTVIAEIDGYNYYNNWPNTWRVATDDNGIYTIDKLHTGNYRVRVYIDGLINGTRYMNEYYNDTYDQNSSTPLNIQEENITSGIDFFLEEGGKITGLVTDEAGEPISWASVYAYDWSKGYSVSTSTDENGIYTIIGLFTGSYSVRAYSTGFIGEYYDNTQDSSAATPIDVTLGETATGINFWLAESGGRITGIVTDKNGTPVEGALISAIDYTHGYIYTSVRSDADGFYTIQRLPSRNYTIKAEPPSGTGLLWEYYGSTYDQNTAIPVDVTEGNTAAGIDFFLAWGGRITGLVTDETGIPVQGCSVNAYDSRGWYAGSAITDTNGVYTVIGLLPGSYVLGTADGRYNSIMDFVGEYYNNTCDRASATAISVSGIGSTVSEINFSLTRYGCITGIVADENGIPIQNANIFAYDFSSYALSNYRAAGLADEDGTYIIKGLPTGSYRIEAVPPDYDNSELLRELFDDAHTWDSIIPVDVSEGNTTSGIDFSLKFGGRITGVVRDENGVPVANTRVRAYELSSGYEVRSQYTGADGIYIIKHVPAGYYRVEAHPSSETGLANEVFHDVSDDTAITPVEVVKGSTTSDIDFSLTPFGSITGAIHDDQGKPVRGAYVYAYDYGTEYQRGTSGVTASDGTYILRNLPTGNYRIEVQNNYSSTVPFEIYEDTQDRGSATPVSVIEGNTTSGIDFSLAEYGKITGSVTDDMGIPITNYNVYIRASDPITGNSVSRNIFLDSNGFYTIENLPAGKYVIEAHDISSGSVSFVRDKYYNNVTDRASATAVDVMLNSTTSGINFVFSHHMGAIRGIITDENGSPISGMQVVVENINSSFWSNGSTSGADGVYTISNVYPGNYRVRTNIDRSQHPALFNKYYNGATDAGSATTVSVVEGRITTGIDIALNNGAEITGLVTGEDGEPIPWAYVYAYDLSGREIGYSRTRADGIYSILGLVTGNYILQVRSPYEPDYNDYVPEYYNDTQDSSSSTPVTATESDITTGINFSIMHYGRITGAVKDDAGKPMANVYVYAGEYTSSYGYYWSAGAYTDSNGIYTIKSLITGDYYVWTNSDDVYKGTYYNNANTSESATLVRVEEGDITSGIDLTVILCGGITGRITDNNGSNLANSSINIYDADSNEWVKNVQSSYDGTYEVKGLVPGNYLIEAGLYGVRAFLSEFYDDARSISSATPVIVARGISTPDINFTLPEGGKISGTITDENGEPIQWAYVYAFDYSTDEMCGSASTSEDGAYVIIGLYTGTYRVAVYGSHLGYVGEIYDDTQEQETAAPVSVAEENTTSNIDFSLRLGGTITGTVKDGHGLFFRNAYILALDYQTDEILGRAYSDVQGRYVMMGLPEGNYRIMVEIHLSPYDDRVTSIFYGDGGDYDSAVQVNVKEGETTSGIDPVIDHGWITGVVSDQLGDPIEGAHVSVWEYQTGLWSCAALTDKNGLYRIGLIFDGSYGVLVEHFSSSEYVWKYYDDSEFYESLTPVPFRENETVSGIDFTLVLGEDALVRNRPDCPAILDPAHGSTGVALTPMLTASGFTDQYGGTHKSSQWDIVDGENMPVMRVTSGKYLSYLEVPALILDPNREYTARVQYTDSYDNASNWSEPVSFTTMEDENDKNANGVPDDQEIASDTDLDGNGVMDGLQTGIKCFNAPDSTGVGIKISTNCSGILSLKYVDPTGIENNSGRPQTIPFGLMDFKIAVHNPGAEAKVVVYFASPVPEGMKWYTYDDFNGWKEYVHAAFSEDRRSVTLTLKDGDPEYGDIDGVANGIIVDPSGIGSEAVITPEQSTAVGGGGGGGGGGGCFISAATGHIERTGLFMMLFILSALCSVQVLRRIPK